MSDYMRRITWAFGEVLATCVILKVLYELAHLTTGVSLEPDIWLTGMALVALERVVKLEQLRDRQTKV